jgi:multimeric flavodoxin WrbA
MAELFIQAWHRHHPGAPVHVFSAYEINAQPCSHCGHCKTENACIYHDLDALDAALRSADVLVIAAPVYVLGFPAPFKSILDRMQRYFEEKFTLKNPAPIPKRKEAVFLTAYGADSEDGVTFMREQLRISFRLMNARLAALVAVPNTDTIPPDFERLRRDFEELAHNLLAGEPK